MDSNHDKGLQRALCYHYTIGQAGLKFSLPRHLGQRKNFGRRLGNTNRWHRLVSNVAAVRLNLHTIARWMLVGMRIPTNSGICSNSFRTVFRDIRTVAGVKRRSRRVRRSAWSAFIFHNPATKNLDAILPISCDQLVERLLPSGAVSTECLQRRALHPAAGLAVKDCAFLCGATKRLILRRVRCRCPKPALRDVCAASRELNISAARIGADELRADTRRLRFDCCAHRRANK